MKKIASYLMVICLLLAFHPYQSNAASSNAASSSLVDPKSAESAEAEALLLRLNEINTMDKSNLKSSEKKDLRMEVRSIRSQLSYIGGGVYLSVGAIIIIILLLILLL